MDDNDELPSYCGSSRLFLDFKIRNGQTHPQKIPYFHRPIAAYSEAFYVAGFAEVHIFEPEHVGAGREHDILVLTASTE